MPEIARPYGILIKQYSGDHPPPHFHVICGEDQALFDAQTLELISGNLPVRAKNLVIEWATLSQLTESRIEYPAPPAVPNVMDLPRIVSVEPLVGRRLLVTFSNGQRKRYDLNPRLADEAFAPLCNHSLFITVKVEQGGYGVSWNADLDLSEYELWQHGESLPAANTD